MDGNKYDLSVIVLGSAALESNIPWLGGRVPGFPVVIDQLYRSNDLGCPCSYSLASCQIMIQSSPNTIMVAKMIGVLVQERTRFSAVHAIWELEISRSNVEGYLVDSSPLPISNKCIDNTGH